MPDTSENNNYIKCSKCRCKYINDEEHIKHDFGYNRLEERFKTCVKFRERGKEQRKMYREAHKEEIAERKKAYNKQQFQNNKEHDQAKHK